VTGLHLSSVFPSSLPFTSENFKPQATAFPSRDSANTSPLQVYRWHQTLLSKMLLSSKSLWNRVQLQRRTAT